MAVTPHSGAGVLRTFITSPRRASLRWWLFYTHLITGVLFGLYFVVIGITGSIIVFEPEISRATMPSPRPVNGPPLPLNRVVDRISEAYPGRSINFIRWYPEPADRYRVRLRPGPEGGTDTYVYIDRATGGVLGESPWWIRWTMELHIYLLGGTTGLKVNGIGALLLGIVSLTGLVVWWPGMRRWARGFKMNLRASWRGLNYDAHRVIGVVSMVVMLAFAFTGFYFGFPALFRQAVGYREIPKSLAPSGTPANIDLDSLVKRADAALPGGIVTVLYPPASNTDIFRFRVKLPGDGWEFGRSEVYFDQYSGELRGIHDVRALSVPQLVFVQWMAPIHYGRFGGMLTRVLWVVSGLVPLVLFISGCLMWWNRSLVKMWRRRSASAPSAYPTRLTHPAES